jgi:RNA polymerase sigma-70 factor (ECF subfamily)
MYRAGKKVAKLGEGSSYISGEIEEFRTVVEEYRSRVYHTAYGIVQNVEDAKDVTQEVFLKIYAKIDTYKGLARLSTWIYRITVNTAIDMTRKRKSSIYTSLNENLSREETDTSGLTGATRFMSPFNATYQHETRKLIQEAFTHLSANHKAVLVLREIEGLSYQQIAEALECSTGTITSRLHYARKKMQKLLEPLRRLAS